MNTILYNKQKTYWMMATIFMAAKICIYLIVRKDHELYRDEMLYFNIGKLKRINNT